MKKSIIAVSLAICSLPAFAGSNGTALTSASFNDYLVRVVGGGDVCTGQLIAGKFVVTAAHCISDNWGGRLSDTWMALSSDGVLTSSQVSAENPRIYFGSPTYTAGNEIDVNGVTIFHEYVYRYQHDSTSRSDYANQVQQQWISDFGLSADQLAGSVYVYGDIAVYKLSDVAAQQTAAMLMTTSKNTQDGVDVGWAGWGITVKGGSASDTANAGSMTYTSFPWDSWWSNIIFYADRETTKTKNGSMVCDGDSGSPVTINGQVLGFTQGTTGSCGDSDSVQRFSSAGFYIPWLAEQINSINTVSKKELKVDAAGAHTVTWTIPVQSLKVDDVTFNPQIVDSTGLFTSDDLSNCEGTFKTGESCSVTVTFNAAGSTVSSNATATLKLNDTLSIPLSYTISSSSSGGTDTGGSGSGSNSGSSSGSSGGGSADWMVVLGLAGMALRRKLRR